MTTITESQRVALVKAADALWDKASAAVPTKNPTTTTSHTTLSMTC